jgi:hypothetical protein
MTPLILKRASASRSSGQWSDDDYDVLENGVVVGRICKEQGAPPDRPWGWASGHNGDYGQASRARLRADARVCYAGFCPELASGDVGGKDLAACRTTRVLVGL